MPDPARVPALDERLRAAIDDAAEATSLPVYLVGGAVRDLLLGRPTLDADLVVEGDGAAFGRALARALGGRLVVHRAFGTAEVFVDDRVLDIATARRERYPYPGALPEVEPASIVEDLERRDFTVNAMALRLAPPPGGELLDPCGGRDDVEAALLRVLHDASFLDDPTRLLRGVRYAARLAFRLEPRTEALARAACTREVVWSVGGTRLRDALALLLGEDAGIVLGALRVLDGLGGLAAVHPGLDTGPATAERLAGWEASRAARPAEPVEPWRARLGIIARGLEPADLDALLEALALSRSDAAAVRAVARARPPLPARPSALADALADLPAEALLAHAVDEPEAVALSLDELRGRRPQLTGDDLQRELGIGPSVTLGAILRELRRRVLDGELTTREAELAAARRLLALVRP
jgi:tRNA nucleotidyltransferase (CCA-adding enzyme)